MAGFAIWPEEPDDDLPDDEPLQADGLEGMARELADADWLDELDS
jgi:hypothetical protein